MRYLGISGMIFENTIAIFEISTLKFVKLQTLVQETFQIWDQKCLIRVFLGWNLKIILS